MNRCSLIDEWSSDDETFSPNAASNSSSEQNVSDTDNSQRLPLKKATEKRSTTKPATITEQNKNTKRINTIVKFLDDNNLSWSQIHGKDSLREAGLTIQKNEKPQDIIEANLMEEQTTFVLQELSTLVKGIVEFTLNLQNVAIVQVIRKLPGTTNQRFHVDVCTNIYNKCIRDGCKLINYIIALNNGVYQPTVITDSTINWNQYTFENGIQHGGQRMNAGESFEFNGLCPHHGNANTTENTQYSIFVSLKNKVNATTDVVTFVDRVKTPSSTVPVDARINKRKLDKVDVDSSRKYVKERRRGATFLNAKGSAKQECVQALQQRRMVDGDMFQNFTDKYGTTYSPKFPIKIVLNNRNASGGFCWRPAVCCFAPVVFYHSIKKLQKHSRTQICVNCSELLN